MKVLSLPCGFHSPFLAKGFLVSKGFPSIGRYTNASNDDRVFRSAGSFLGVSSCRGRVGGSNLHSCDREPNPLCLVSVDYHVYRTPQRTLGGRNKAIANYK